MEGESIRLQCHQQHKPSSLFLCQAFHSALLCSFDTVIDVRALTSFFATLLLSLTLLSVCRKHSMTLKPKPIVWIYCTDTYCNRGVCCYHRQIKERWCHLQVTDIYAFPSLVYISPKTFALHIILSLFSTLHPVKSSLKCPYLG